MVRVLVLSAVALLLRFLLFKDLSGIIMDRRVAYRQGYDLFTSSLGIIKKGEKTNMNFVEYEETKTHSKVFS